MVFCVCFESVQNMAYKLLLLPFRVCLHGVCILVMGPNHLSPSSLAGT